MCLRCFHPPFTSLNPSPLSLYFVRQHLLDLSGRKVTTEVLKTVAETCAANLSTIKLNSLASDLNYQVMSMNLYGLTSSLPGRMRYNTYLALMKWESIC